jgi:hypothetical protein
VKKCGQNNRAGRITPPACIFFIMMVAIMPPNGVFFKAYTGKNGKRKKEKGQGTRVSKAE